MATTDMTKIPELSPLAKQLNTSSDELNAALQKIETALNELAIGIEVWCDEERLTRSVHDVELDDGRIDYRVVTETVLGYAREIVAVPRGTAPPWALLVKTQKYNLFRDSDGDWARDPDSMREVSRRRLSTASRAIRLAAVPVLEPLIDILKQAATEAVDAVAQAKTIADSLT